MNLRHNNNSQQNIDDHPLNDAVKSRTTTAKEETRGLLISHRPPGAFESNWGETLLEEHKDYLKTDARTEEGRLDIARVNDVVDEWKTCLSEYDTRTSCAKKNYDLALMIARKGVRVNFGFGHAEGFHRAGSSIQAMTGSRIDSETGVIDGPGDLTYQYFVDANVIKDDSFKKDANFQDVVETALTGKCMFFDEPSNVEVKWMSTPIETTSARVILAAFKEVSRQTSDNKYQSVRKNCLVSIGSMGRTALYGLDVNDYDHRPDTSKAAPFCRTTIQSVTNAAKSLEAAEKEK